jgi:hypothetical protein
MNGPVSWEQITFFFGLLTSIIVLVKFLWDRVEMARKASRDEMAAEQTVRQNQIDKLRGEFNDHRVAVAQNYASQTMLDKVEERIGGSLDEMKADIAALRGDIAKMGVARRQAGR